MDFSKSIYIKENEYLDGRSIVMFDCDTSFRWTKETNPFLITYIIKLLNKSIHLSKKHCGHEEFSVMVNLKNIKKQMPRRNARMIFGVDIYGITNGNHRKRFKM